MAEEIGFENGRNSNFEGLVTLTLTLDLAIRHTVVHHSSTSTYIPNFIQIEETFCGRTDGRTYGHFSPLILLGRLLEVDLIIRTNINATSIIQCFSPCFQWLQDVCKMWPMFHEAMLTTGEFVFHWWYQNISDNTLHYFTYNWHQRN